MKIEFDKVAEVIDDVVKASENGTSGYLYVPKKLKGRKVKVLIFEDDS